MKIKEISQEAYKFIENVEKLPMSISNKTELEDFIAQTSKVVEITLYDDVFDTIKYIRKKDKKLLCDVIKNSMDSYTSYMDKTIKLLKSFTMINCYSLSKETLINIDNFINAKKMVYTSVLELYECIINKLNEK